RRGSRSARSPLRARRGTSGTRTPCRSRQTPRSASSVFSNCRLSTVDCRLLSGSQPVNAPHREAGPAPHLLVDPSHVLAYDAEPSHRDSEQREEDREEREDPLDLGTHDQPPHEEEETEGDPSEGDDRPEKAEELDRH